MQRLHEDDLVGHVLEKEYWEHIKLPAIAEDDEAHLIDSRYRRCIVHRKVGEALHPEREPIEVLKQLRRTVGEYNFTGQYQQQPSPIGGGLVKAKWFRSYLPEQQPPKFDLVFHSWDTANKSTELSDYSVCTVWGLRGKRLYLLHVLRERLDYPSLKRAVWSMSQEYQPQNILIEDKASGTQLIQELINDGVYGVTRYEPRMDKIMRLHSVTSTIENGFVYLPAETEWLSTYLHEITAFPNAKHDDQTDSTSQALDWAKGQLHRYPLLDYYRHQAVQHGWPIDPSLLNTDELETYELGRGTCLECGNRGPARYGRKYQCNQCGNQWQTVQGLSNDPSAIRCRLPSGEALIWDYYTNFWVDPVTGDTHASGNDSG
jgi:predicted phage terminase large subunit-like protein